MEVEPIVFAKLLAEQNRYVLDECGGYALVKDERVVWASGGLKGGGARVTADYMPAMLECVAETGVAPNCQWHTHPEMGAFWSDVDEKDQLNTALRALKKPGKIFFIVLDNFDWLCRSIAWDGTNAEVLAVPLTLMGVDLVKKTTYGYYTQYDTYPAYAEVFVPGDGCHYVAASDLALSPISRIGDSVSFQLHGKIETGQITRLPKKWTIDPIPGDDVAFNFNGQAMIGTVSKLTNGSVRIIAEDSMVYDVRKDLVEVLW